MFKAFSSSYDGSFEKIGGLFGFSIENIMKLKNDI